MIVMTLGTFDLFHFGHVNLLYECKRFAGNGLVIVGLNTDSFVQEFKKTKPVMTYAEREQTLLGCKYVDVVVKNIGGADSKVAVEAYEKDSGKRVDMIVVGSDWHKKDYLAQTKFNWGWFNKKNIGLCYVSYTSGISTSKLKERLRSL